MRAPMRSSSGPGASSASCRVARLVDERVCRVQPGRCQLTLREGHLPRDRDGGHPLVTGQCGDRCRRLAVQGLRVERALTGDDQVGPGDGIRQPGQLEDQLGSRSGRRTEHGEQTEADPASGSGARFVAAVVAGGSSDDVGPMRQRRVEQLDVRGSGALLGSVDRRGAAAPCQRVVHVAGDDQLCPGQTGVQAAQLEHGRVAETGSTGVDLSAAGCADGRTEGLEQTRAAVGARAPADGHDHPPGTRVEGSRDQLTGAPAGSRRAEPCGAPGSCASPDTSASSTTASVPRTP